MISLVVVVYKRVVNLLRSFQRSSMNMKWSLFVVVVRWKIESRFLQQSVCIRSFNISISNDCTFYSFTRQRVNLANQQESILPAHPFSKVSDLHTRTQHEDIKHKREREGHKVNPHFLYRTIYFPPK